VFGDFQLASSQAWKDMSLPAWLSGTPQLGFLQQRTYQPDWYVSERVLLTH
jgi:hypothetical protein